MSSVEVPVAVPIGVPVAVPIGVLVAAPIGVPVGVAATPTACTVMRVPCKPYPFRIRKAIGAVALWLISGGSTMRSDWSVGTTGAPVRSSGHRPTARAVVVSWLRRY